MPPRHLVVALVLLFAWIVEPPLLPAAPQDVEEPVAEGGADDEKKKKKDDDKPKKPGLRSSTFGGIKLRGIGPALMSGRLSDIAIDPTNRNRWLCGTASGGLWETTNAGTTWTPRFDSARRSTRSAASRSRRRTRTSSGWAAARTTRQRQRRVRRRRLQARRDGGRTYKNVGLEGLRAHRQDPRASDRPR